MRALIADPDLTRRAAVEGELLRHGYEIEVRDAPPASADGFDLVCLGGTDALARSRALAPTQALVIVVGEIAAEEVVRFVGVQADAGARRDEQRRLVSEQSARVAAQRAERRSTFLAEASPLLDASLDLRSTLDSLTRLSVPFLGDVCIVDEIHLNDIRRLAAAAADPVVERIVRDLPARYPVDPDDPIARVVDSGRAEILTGAGAGVFGPTVGSGRLQAEFGRAAMLVPLKARGRIIGIVVFVSLDAARRYDMDDLLLAEDLARRAALALDNARLYEDLGGVARALQAALLPQRLPDLVGVELAARFRPAGDGSLIGGDFYDVLPFEGGVDLVIGDVTGKGARAAALTSLVRHTVRTAARYEERPSRVLDVVNRTLISERSERGGRYCTVAFCRLELNGSARATICCAGHPMPMVMRGSGGVDHVGSPGSVLGWVDDPKLLDIDFELAPHESLVLFTDGVTEARTTGDAYGLSGLESLLRAAAGDDAAGVAARVDQAAALAGERRDDVAVLVARRGGTSAG
ncbi:MAG TPA: GAF domain-containing SpoIIE family protein phosphatase [Solirubrobacter sp.]